jgi:hypothetical protein
MTLRTNAGLTTTTPNMEKSRFLSPEQQALAEQTIETGLRPLRRSFEKRFETTVEDLSRRGVLAGGTTREEALRDILFEPQAFAEKQLAGEVTASLGRTAQEQAFAASEAAKTRQLQEKLQTSGFKFQETEAERGREFTGEQAGAGRELQRELQTGGFEEAGRAREFSAEESGKIREFQAAQAGLGREFQATQAEIDRQIEKNQRITELVISGNIAGPEAEALIADAFGPGVKLTTQDELDLQRAALASGLTTEQYLELRKVIGEGQLLDVLENPEDYIQNPRQAREFQLQLARIAGEGRVSRGVSGLDVLKLGVSVLGPILSDKRLKFNIKPINDSLEFIKNINFVQFNWKATQEMDFGVIAQQVQKIKPELVVDKEEFLKVNYFGLFSITADAVKKVINQVEELAQKVKEIENA